MTETKTIRVKRHTITGRFEGAGLSVHAYDYDDADELDITIAEVKSIKQQRREARVEALDKQVLETGVHPAPWLAVNIIESVDAEFDREREAERRERLHAAICDVYGSGPETIRLIDALEAIYRGER